MRRVILSIAVGSLVPGLALAAPSGCASASSSLECFARMILDILGVATALLTGVAIVIYFGGIAYNMFGYSNQGSPKSFQNLQQNLIWGLGILFVIFSIWGIIRLFGSALFNTTNFNSLF